jgi:diguanylate cyclase (GGDEF)-like protein
MKKYAFKQLVIKYIPFILAAIGILLSVTSLMIDSFIPHQYRSILWIFSTGFYITLCTLLGISLKKLYRSLSTDNLTGLYTRSYLYSQFNEEINKMAKTKSSMSMLMIDVDRFKIINDNYGHIAGDAILKQLSVLLRKALKNNQTVIRWGGEEFLIMLPNTDNETANDIAENIRTSVLKETFLYENIRINTTVSIGVVTTEQIIDIEDLVNTADQLLYQAKVIRNTIISESFYSMDTNYTGT